ncbi:MAG: O-antigen ligase family protein, partial [Gemmatimonadales bacterium]
FAMYANLPVVAIHYHGAPRLSAAAPLVMLGVPTLYLLVVRRERVIVDDPLRLMAVFLGVLVLSAAWAKDRGIASQWIVTYASEGLLVYFLVVNVIRDRVILKRAIWSLLAAGAFMGLACVYSEVTHSYHSALGGLVQRQTAPDEVASADTAVRDRLDGTFSTSRRATGPIGEVNRFAQILLVLLPLAFFRFHGERRLPARLLAAASGALILAGFLLSYSRSAFLILGVLIVVLTVMGYIRPLQLVGVGLLLTTLVVVAAPGYVDRIQSIADVRSLFDDSGRAEADGATRGRVTEMMAALGAFSDHPVLGVGPGQYQPFYSMRYQVNSRYAFRYIPKPRRAHSLYFELAAETGVIGLLSFGSVLLVLLRGLWIASRSLARSDPELGSIATALWFAIVAYLGMGVFLHLAYQRYFWLLLAMGGAAVQVCRMTMLVESGERHAGVSGEHPDWQTQN